MPADPVVFVFPDLYLGNEIDLDKHGVSFYLAEIRQWYFNYFQKGKRWFGFNESVCLLKIW